jgi:hypothetical protein
MIDEIAKSASTVKSKSKSTERKFFSTKCTLERFLLYISNSNHPNGCWIWEGIFSHNGYGRFRLTGGKRIPASRFSYELFRGEIPEKLLVLHTCDNPPCVNPEHLWVGTIKENMQDMAKKGRSYFQTHADKILRRKGINHPRSKLTDKIVIEMRQLSKSGMTNRALGIKFNISEYTVSGIILGKEWKHV